MCKYFISKLSRFQNLFFAFNVQVKFYEGHFTNKQYECFFEVMKKWCTINNVRKISQKIYVKTIERLYGS